MNKKTQIIVSTITLIIGGFIYILYRTKSLIMFSWFSKLSLINSINTIRQYTIPHKNEIPSWVIYALPDGLWLYSFTSSMLLIWNYKITHKNIFWVFGLPTIAILSEIAQYGKLLQGIFDPIDLLCYTSGIFMALFLQKKQIQYKF